MKNFKSLFKVFGIFAVSSSLFIVACDKRADISDNQVPSPQETKVAGVYDEDMVTLARSLAASMKDKDMRNAIKNEANKTFDDDFDILWDNFKSAKVAGSTVEKTVLSKASSSTSSLKTVQSRLPLLNIAVPVNIDKWNTDNFTPLVAVIPSGIKDKDLKELKAYDSDGNEHILDAKKRPDYPVVVIGNNERLTYSAATGYASNNSLFNRQEKGKRLPEDEPSGSTTPSPCSIKYGDRLAIGAFKTKDVSFIEGWFKGAPEIMVTIGAANGPNNTIGTRITDGITNVPSRSIIDDKWFVMDTPNYKFWWEEVYGELLTVELSEQDSDAGSFFDTPIEVEVAGKKYSTNIFRFLHNSHDYIGKFQVSRRGCLPDENGNDNLFFRMVSVN